MDRSEADGRQKPSSLRFSLAAIVLGLLLGAAAIWGANKEALGLFHDDGIYAVVAKAISQGDGYRIISLPTAPPQTKYPFLYSYVLSWLWTINPSFPGNILLLKAFNIGVLVAIFFVAIAFYRRVFPAATLGALIFGVLVCTNPIIFTYTDYVVSDLLFVLLALAGLYFARTAPARILPMGALAGLACLTRLAAAPLVFAGAIQAVLSRGWRGATYFAGTVSLLVAPWFLWVSFNRYQDQVVSSLLGYYHAYDFSFGDYGGVGELFAKHERIVTSNARYLAGTFDLLYLLPLMPWLTPFVALFTGLGMVASLRREDMFAWAFFLSSLALLLVWPFHPGRYVAPLVPLLVLFLFRGMAAAEHWITTSGSDYLFKELLAKLPWAPIALILLLNGVWLSSYLLIRDEQTTRGGYGSRAPYGWAGFEESFAWIRQNTATEARLGTAYDPMYFLYTGRQAVRPAFHRSATYFYPYGQAKPDVGSVSEIKPELEKMRLDYLIIDPLDGYAEGKATIKLFDEIVAAYGDKAQRVFTSSDGKHRIYALGRE
jgi:hypothetical protein